MLALGCDHGGYELMQEVKKHLEKRGIAYHDFGCSSTESVDYPVYGKKVAEAENRCKDQTDARHDQSRDCFCAEATRLHNDANILAMGGRVVGPGLALKIVDTFLDTPFSGDERHIRRIRMIEEA